MKLPFSKSSVLLALFAIWFNTSFSQCYVQEFNHSGSNNFYSTSLSDLACEVKDLIELQSGVTDFPVAGFVLYPVMAYADPNDGYEELRDNIEEQYISNDDSGLYFIKAIQPDGNVEIYTVLNLPDHYDTIYNPIELLSIANEIINEAESKINTNSIVAESAAMQKLSCLLSGTCDPVDPVENSGFKEINFGEATVTYTADGSIDENQTTDIYDLAGIKVNDEYIRIEAGNAAVTNLRKPALIITSDIEHGDPNGYTLNQQFTNGNEYFESSLENLFVVWMHFKDNGRAYYKTKINFSEAEAKTLVELYFDQAKQDLVENIEGAIVGNSKDTQLRTDNCDSASCDNIFKLRQWSAKCCIYPHLADDAFVESILTGTIDGLAQLLFFLYDMGKGLQQAAEATPFTLSWFKDAYDSCVKEGSILKGMGKKLSKDKKFWSDLFETAKNIFNNASSLVSSVWNSITDFLNDLNPMTGPLKETGYALGLVVFELVMTFLTGGTSVVKLAAVKFSSITKTGLQTLRTLKPQSIGKSIISGFNHTKNTARNALCRIGIGGCFVKDTPVLMANNANRFSLRNSTKALAVAAAMPIVAVPIQDVQLLDYAVCHKTVNADYGLTASTDDDIYLGLLNKDPYTSDQQRERDEYEINDTDWNEVVFEEVNGGSTAKLALHKDWIIQKGYKIDGVVNLDLPEQGISGPFKITSIKHIVPQKKPIDEHESDDYDYKPVTALFTHESNQVYNIDFDNGESLGVTYQHPIYSASEGDWVLAGELEIGEKVLTYNGETEVLSSEKKEEPETVYNLEVKELHNFLVGESGIVVHNNYGIVQAILNGIHNATKQWHKLYKCKEYGTALRAHLKSKGVQNPMTIAYRLFDSNGNRVQMRIFRNGEEIATNGLHVGTPINGKMYDNMYPDGIDLDPNAYKNLFEYPPHLELRADIIDASQKISDIY